MNQTEETRKIDRAARTVAQFAGNGDGTNPVALFTGMEICATFGAGTNSTSIQKVDGRVMLYKANDYGKFVEYYRPGPWCERIFKYAEKLADEEEKRQDLVQQEKAKAEAAKFAPVDF